MIGRKTQYRWNNFTFFFFNIDVGVSQSFVFSPIFFVLYFSLIFYIWKKTNNLKILISFLSFVNNSLFIFQEKSLKKNGNLFCSYNIIFSLLKQFGLAIEYRKSEVFHFSRSYGVFNLFLLNLNCYNLKSLVLDKRTHSCIRVNTRKLDKELFIK